ncbi:MAG: HD domain-containing protein [Acetatifactor sp.]|nr:HD domain-containing protein [Acetatifactor sp.]
MRTITKMELEPGMVIGEDIIHNGNVIFKKNTSLDPEKISKLNRYPILCVSILEAVDFATTHYEKLQYDEKFIKFRTKYDYVLLKFKEFFMKFVNNNTKIPDDLLLSMYSELEDLLPSRFSILDYLYNMIPNEDELTFTQCLNSALLGGSIANWMSMNFEAKKTLILCGFYYDIGKLKLPYDILWKNGKLTDEEYDTVKTHPKLGYDMVKNLNLNSHIKNAVLMHHERTDGSGYPMKLHIENIDNYARYMGIIDSYTAMASPRPHRTALSPFEILGRFEDSLDKYDAEILIPVMKSIADSQIGKRIRLSDGSEWEVLIIHPNKFSRPIIKNDNNDIMDLLEHNEMSIIGVV